MSKDSTQQRTQDGQRIVRCGVCDRTEECSAEDILCYTRKGWPKCCGGVMGYFMKAEKPGADDTKLDAPPVPPT